MRTAHTINNLLSTPYTAVGVRVYVMNPIAAIHCVRVGCRVLSFVDADYQKQLRTAVYCTWYIFFLLYS